MRVRGSAGATSWYSPWMRAMRASVASPAACRITYSLPSTVDLEEIAGFDRVERVGLAGDGVAAGRHVAEPCEAALEGGEVRPHGLVAKHARGAATCRLQSLEAQADLIERERESRAGRATRSALETPRQSPFRGSARSHRWAAPRDPSAQGSASASRSHLTPSAASDEAPCQVASCSPGRFAASIRRAPRRRFVPFGPLGPAGTRTGGSTTSRRRVIPCSRCWRCLQSHSRRNRACSARASSRLC